MPISQQTVTGNSCGACAGSYALEELLNKVLSANEIKTLWNKIKFDGSKGSAEIVPKSGIQYDHSDPTKLAGELATYGLKTSLYRSTGSKLSGVDAILHDAKSITDGKEGMNLISGKNGGYAIGIYSVSNVGLHFILTKFSNKKYCIMDSNAKAPAYVEGPSILGNNTTFQAKVDNVGFTYQYLGACIVVSK